MNRFWLAALALFWVVMNVLLWRAEFGAESASGSPLPYDVVWQKILDTPDQSRMEIRHHGQRIGYCNWSVQQAETEADFIETDEIAEDSGELAGMIAKVAYYGIRLTGNLEPKNERRRIKFGLNSTLAGSRTWKKFDLTLDSKSPQGDWKLQLAGEGSNEKITLRFTQNDSTWEQHWTMDDFRNPTQLLAGLGVSLPLLGFPLMPELSHGGNESIDFGLEWEARTDWITVAHSRLRVYRLETEFLDKYKITFIVSRAGEIFRAELPQNVTLVNDALLGL